jgi:CCR4-NOT transcriptional regulation complex NOT5 subunit
MKKIIALVAASGLALMLSGCSLIYPNWGTDQNPSTSQSAQPSESASGTPTPVETNSTKGEATVVVDQANVDATAGFLSVVAQVTNFNEDGGTCTLTVQAGNQSKTMSVKAESNVTTTQCFPMEISLSGLPKGTALVTVTYESAAHFGVSAGRSVLIP